MKQITERSAERSAEMNQRVRQEGMGMRVVCHNGIEPRLCEAASHSSSH